MTPLLAASLTGVLLGASFSPSPFGWLLFVAWIPLLYSLALNAEKMSRRSIVGTLYACFFLYHGITNWWVMSWQENTDPYLFLSGIVLWLGHPFFLSLPFYALASIRRRFGLKVFLWSAPLAITGFEWLHGQSDASYPWLSTGYSLVDLPFGQLADSIGVYGLGFLAAAVGTMLAAFFVQRSRGSKSWILPASTLILLVVWFTIGSIKEEEWGAVEQVGAGDPDALSVVIVQPNEDPWDKWSDPEEQIRVHRELVDAVRSDGYQPDLVVWSETAIPFTIMEPKYRANSARLRHWVDTSGFSLLTGFADEVVYGPNDAPPSARRFTADPSLRYDVFNAAMLLNDSTFDYSVHHKSMLTPFAERLPFADQLTFAMSWIEWGVGISSWGKGRTRMPLPLVRGGDTVANIGTVICIESIYPEVAQDQVHNESDILCVITNDAWYNGTWGPAQHYDIARMRAVEQRRTVLRCAMSGESGVILPSGGAPNVDYSSIEPMKRGVVKANVKVSEFRTFYSKHGDVLPPIGLIVTLILVVSARFPSVVRKLRVRT